MVASISAISAKKIDADTVAVPALLQTFATHVAVLLSFLISKTPTSVLL